MSGPYNYVVFRDKPGSGSYHAVRTSDNVEISSSASAPEQVLQAALDQPLLGFDGNGFGPGDIYVHGGLYQFSPAFSGLLLRSYTRVTLDATAILEVPGGYDGAVVQLLADNTTSILDSIFDGGRIRESKTGGVQRRWTAFMLKSTAHDADGDPNTSGPNNGVMFCKITNTVVVDAGTGIAMCAVGDQNSFVNANKFEFLRFYSQLVGIDFQVFNGYQLGEEAGGISYNNVVDVQFEVDFHNFTAGIRNVSGVHNTFTSVSVWDARTTPVMTITDLADRTLIIGGALGGEYLRNSAVIQDNGTDTRVVY